MKSTDHSFQLLRIVKELQILEVADGPIISQKISTQVISVSWLLVWGTGRPWSTDEEGLDDRNKYGRSVEIS